MDQERVAMQIKNIFLFTGEFALKALYEGFRAGVDITHEIVSNKTFTSETKWNRLMATADPKDIRTFLSSEINADKLKTYLKQEKVGFSIRNEKNGQSTLLFEAKNKSLIENAFNRLIDDIAKDPKALNDKLLKSPKNMNFQEKLNHFKNKSDVMVTEQLKKNPVVKAPKMEGPELSK